MATQVYDVFENAVDEIPHDQWKTFESTQTDIDNRLSILCIKKQGMCGAEYFPAGRGEDKNPRGGAGQKNA